MRVVRKRIEEQIGKTMSGEMLGDWSPRRKYQPLGATPRAAASRARLARAKGLASNNHSTLPGTARNNPIQTSKKTGVILKALLKQQKTKPASGSPYSKRVGVAGRNLSAGRSCTVAIG